MGWGKRTLAGWLGALWLAGPATAATAPANQARTPAPVARPQSEPRPAIWLLSDADTRIYLFGTVHVLHPGLRWRSASGGWPGARPIDMSRAATLPGS